MKRERITLGKIHFFTHLPEDDLGQHQLIVRCGNRSLFGCWKHSFVNVLVGLLQTLYKGKLET